MRNLQNDLIKFTNYELELAKSEIKEALFNKIRGVAAFWSEIDETAYITFYYDGEIKEDDIEVASEICIYIISHLIKGCLNKNYTRLDYPNPLPDSDFWAYKR
jgi:hypothetical protein